MTMIMPQMHVIDPSGGVEGTGGTVRNTRMAVTVLVRLPPSCWLMGSFQIPRSLAVRNLNNGAEENKGRARHRVQDPPKGRRLSLLRQKHICNTSPNFCSMKTLSPPSKTSPAPASTSAPAETAHYCTPHALENQPSGSPQAIMPLLTA